MSEEATPADTAPPEVAPPEVMAVDVTPAVYKPGSIKQQAPGTGGPDPAHADMQMIAVRTNLPDVAGMPGMSPTEQDWFVMCVYRGGHFATYEEVQGWPDIYIETNYTGP